MQIGYQHLLLEISKDLMGAESYEILSIIDNALSEVGQLLFASSIVIQLFGDLNDMDDDIIYWSLNDELLEPISQNEQLFDFFILDNPHISKGSVVKAFGDKPFENDNLVYSMYVNNQPIGFLKIELMHTTNIACTKKMISHTVDIFTRAIERMTRDTMVIEQASLIHATLIAVGFSIIVVNANGKIELINREAENLLKIDESRCLGKAIDGVAILHIIENQRGLFFEDLISNDDDLPVFDIATLLVQGQQIQVKRKLYPIYDSNQLYQGAVIVLDNK